MLASSVRLLVTSDDALFAKIKTICSEFEEMHIVRKPDLKSGLNFLKRHKSSSVLIDLNLNEINDSNKFIELMKGYSSCPVVALASPSDPDFAFKTLLTGAQDYLFVNDLTLEGINKSINFASFKLMGQLKEAHFQERIKRKTDNLEQIIRDKREQLQLSEESYRNLVNLVPVSILILNSSYDITFANSQFLKVFDYDPKVRESKSIFDLFRSPEDRERIERILRSVSGKKCNVLAQLKQKNGENIWCSIAVSHHNKNDHQLGEYVVTLEDITERKIQEKLDLENQIHKETNKVKTQFLQSISHEIRTPLTSIDGFIDMALYNCKDAEVLDNLITIKNNASQLKSLIYELLDFSKMETGELDIEFSRFSLFNLIESAVNIVLPRAKSKNIELQVEYGSMLPEKVCSDKHKLKQILLTLLNHVVQCSKSEARVRLSISVDMLNNGHGQLCAKIFSSDPNDCESILERIFSPFAVSNKEYKIDKNNFGYGLMAIKRLANELGGDIKLSQLDRDNEIEYELDLDLGSLKSVPFYNHSILNKNKHIEEATMLDVSDKSKPLSGINILIAEDSQDLQSLFKFIINQMGGDLTLCSDGTEVFDLIEKKSFDLILLDIQMPKMNGDEVVKILRSKNYNGPVLALTAHAFKEEKNYCLQVGFDDFITKPFEFEHLERMILKYATKKDKVTKKSSVISGLKKEEYKELLTIFYTNLKENVALLDQALEGGDISRIKQLSHKIKGSSSCYGYADISSIAKSMNVESNKESPQVDHIKQQLGLIKEELKSVEEEYNELVS